MSSVQDNESGFSESDIYFARQTFFRDCPNGRCSKQKFLTFIRKSSVHKTIQSSTHIIKILQNNHHSKKFFSMMFDVYDRNHDGELDFDEYLYALSAISGANRLRTIETLFNFFDVHNQGYITREDFNSRKKLAARFFGQFETGINKNLSYEEAFNAMDLDKDERISKEEFFRWHLKDQLISEETEPIRRRTRLLKNLSGLVDIRGEIKTSSLQNPVDVWLETSMNVNNNNTELSETINADGYLSKVFRRARNRFHRRKSTRDDSQSDSGVFTSSSTTSLTNTDLDSNSLLDIEEDDFQSILSNDTESQVLCQSLKDVLMQTLIELKQRKQQQQLNNNYKNQRSMSTRL